MKKIVSVYFLLHFFIQILVGQTGRSSFQSVYISKTPKPTAPAKLDVSNILFSDNLGNRNSILDANEKGEISFNLTNSGKGDAYNLVLEIQETNNISGLLFSNTKTIGNLPSGTSSQIKMLVNGNMQLVNGKASLNLRVKEGNGFDADPFTLSFVTQEFKTPLITIADAIFTNIEGEGKVKLGQMVNLKLLIQNKGQGEATNIKVSLINPNNVYPGNETEYVFNSLKPNESKVVNYEFFANKQYDKKEIAIQTIITENYGKYGLNISKAVSLDQTLAQTQHIDINAKPEEAVKITDVSLISDVDKNIPDNNIIKSNRYALIIGNEDYSSYQSGIAIESNVEFARNDARIFMQYCNKTLGFPEDNITLITDGTAGKIKQSIDKLNKLIQNSNGKLEIVFYYAGHGLPDEKTHDSYLIPVDINGCDLQNAIRLNDVYNSLTQYPSSRITVFLDACFSGGGRNQGLISARGVKIKPKESVLRSNITVFTASTGEQTSLPYKDKQHGMFTYFLLKKIQDTKGEITYNDLADYITNQVKFESIKRNSKEQNPQVNISSDISDIWGSWKLK